MTTKEHVIQLVERLDDEQLVTLEQELVTRLGNDAAGDSTELPYDPLGSIIGMFSSNDGVTDVSSNKYKYVADAIQHW